MDTHRCKVCDTTHKITDCLQMDIPAAGVGPWAQLLIEDHIDLRQCSCGNTLCLPTSEPAYQQAVWSKIGIGLVHEVTETTIQVSVRRAAA